MRTLLILITTTIIKNNYKNRKTNIKSSKSHKTHTKVIETHKHLPEKYISPKDHH